MLKILFLSMTCLFFKKQNMLLPMCTMLIFLILLKMMNPFIMILDNNFINDNISFILMILSLMSFLLIMLSSNNIMNIHTMMSLILVMLLFIFTFTNMIMFYITFELILIPTILLITMMGKQPERLQASIYLMIYTILASLPLFIIILIMPLNKSFILSSLLLNYSNMIILIIMAFLVKTPMFITHLWLPKAHVEAPLEGSMILAAILLKMGGYGLIRFIPMTLKKMSSISSWIFAISIVGTISTSLNCSRQKDLKSLIAYSSVAHMALVLLGIFSMNSLGMKGAIMMMIAHGLSSSALFLLSNDIYLKYHSRNIMSFKGLMSILPNITFWWFMFMAINISAPPSINTMSEIFIMMSMILWQKYNMIMIMLMSISVTIFSMFMFLNINHNKNKMKPSSSSSYKIMMSLFIHLTPLIMMIVKMETMML